MGLCCVGCLQASLWPALFHSGGEAEHPVDERPLRRRVVGGHGAHLSLGQHRHGLDPGQRPSRRPEAAEAEHRPGSALDPAVVLLDGLITNDKFCLVRRTRLRLSWSRLALRCRSARPDAAVAESLPQGGTDAMPMDGTPDDAAGSGRPTPLGPGLPRGADLEGGTDRRVRRRGARPRCVGGRS
jgi:hypothetical protein